MPGHGVRDVQSERYLKLWESCHGQFLPWASFLRPCALRLACKEPPPLNYFNSLKSLTPLNPLTPTAWPGIAAAGCQRGHPYFALLPCRARRRRTRWRRRRRRVLDCAGGVGRPRLRTRPGTTGWQAAGGGGKFDRGECRCGRAQVLAGGGDVGGCSSCCRLGQCGLMRRASRAGRVRLGLGPVPPRLARVVISVASESTPSRACAAVLGAQRRPTCRMCQI